MLQVRWIFLGDHLYRLGFCCWMNGLLGIDMLVGLKTLVDFGDQFWCKLWIRDFVAFGGEAKINLKKQGG